MPLFMPMLSFGPYLAFLSPDMPPSVFEQLLSDTQGTVYLVLVFFLPQFLLFTFRYVLFMYIGAFSFSAGFIFA